jgi:hypothetical protein
MKALRRFGFVGLTGLAMGIGAGEGLGPVGKVMSGSLLTSSQLAYASSASGTFSGIAVGSVAPPIAEKMDVNTVPEQPLSTASNPSASQKPIVEQLGDLVDLLAPFHNKESIDDREATALQKQILAATESVKSIAVALSSPEGKSFVSDAESFHLLATALVTALTVLRTDANTVLFEGRSTLLAGVKLHHRTFNASQLNTAFALAVALLAEDKHLMNTIAETMCSESFRKELRLSERVHLIRSLAWCAKKNLLSRAPNTLQLLISVTTAANVKSLTPSQCVSLLDGCLQLSQLELYDTNTKLSRMILPNVDSLSTKQLIIVLKASALMIGLQNVLAKKVVARLCRLNASLTTRQLGDICLAFTRIKEKNSPLHEELSPEIRRFVPLLVTRAEKHNNEFSPRDARNILNFLRSHRVQHGILFSSLSRFLTSTRID